MAAAMTFDKWRSSENDRGPLRLRISLHYASSVFVHKNRGYWASDDLNVFIKYEREIGISGTVAVTDVFHQYLSGSAMKKFKGLSRIRYLSARPGRVIVKRIHYAPIGTEEAVNRTDPLSFFEWLRSESLPSGLCAAEVLGPSEFIRASIGDTSVLFAAPQPHSPITVDFARGSNKRLLDLTDQENKHWLKRQKEIRNNSKLEGKEDTKSVSPFRIVRPLTDIPIARIHYSVENWSRARGFHQLLSDKAELRKRLALQGLNLLGKGTAFPGIACCHMIVRTAETVGGNPTLVLCQRQRQGQGHDDTYYPGRWSLTCEEQMLPNESVSQCVKRGLAQELLGAQGTDGLTVRVLGAVLEQSILNLALIVLVDVPMTFRQIAGAWRSAVDKDEHSQITHLAVNRDVYDEVAAGGVISEVTRSAIRPGDRATFATTKEWRVHPTTLARMAFALWAQEMFSRSRKAPRKTV